MKDLRNSWLGLTLAILFSFTASGCGVLLFGAGAATGAAVADDDDGADVEIEND